MILLFPFAAMLAVTYARDHLERNFLRDERQHCLVYGDRFSLCTTSLSFTDPCAGPVQRILRPPNRPIRAPEPFIQVSTLMPPPPSINEDSRAHSPI